MKRLKTLILNAIRREPDVKTLRQRGLRVGEGVYVGRGVTFDPGFLWLIEVGDSTTLSANVEVLAHDASMKRHLGYTLVAPVSIGRRVYIGLGAIIMPGVSIGDDSIVGAGSVVRNDVAPRTVVAGVPARTVNTLEAHLDKHRLQMKERPVYPANGFTVRGDVTRANMRRMQHELGDGPGYVE